MAYLHYGTEMRISLGADAVKRVIAAVGAHASRGGWVTVADTAGREWSFLVTVGIPIWIDPSE